MNGFFTQCFLVLLRPIINPTCRNCGTEEETSAHISVRVWGFSLTQAYISGFLFSGPGRY